jgi:nitroreductase
MLKQIQHRRSHFLKEFNGKKAPDELIQTVLNTAVWAPSHKLTLPFRFTVFGPEKLQLISETVLKSYHSRNSETDDAKIAKIQSWPNKLSHIIAIILKPSGKVPLWEEYASLGAAVQNMYLMIGEQSEYGAYWTTGNEMDAPLIREVLDLQDQEIHCGYFFVGGINEQRQQANRPPTEVTWK